MPLLYEVSLALQAYRGSKSTKNELQEGLCQVLPSSATPIFDIRLSEIKKRASAHTNDAEHQQIHTTNSLPSTNPLHMLFGISCVP
jgi:hypothetical protein